MIIFHADDYGILMTLSERIVECIKAGGINSVSVMSNSRCFDETMEMLNSLEKKVLKTVHLNVVEGYALSSMDEVRGLIDSNGGFKPSFLKYLLCSFIPGLRKKYYGYFYAEIDKQIEKALPFVDKDAIRLDSHGHYHMLPVFFDAMMQVVSDRGLKLEYIRLPREIVSFYKESGVKASFINLIKVVVLNFLYKIDFRRHKAELKNLRPGVFVGVMLSGNMNYDDVSKVFPYAKKYAEEHGCDLEVLFHPGGTADEKEISQVTFVNDREFFMSGNRQIEAKACVSLQKHLI